MPRCGAPPRIGDAVGRGGAAIRKAYPRLRGQDAAGHRRWPRASRSPLGSGDATAGRRCRMPGSDRRTSAICSHAGRRWTVSIRPIANCRAMEKRSSADIAVVVKIAHPVRLDVQYAWRLPLASRWRSQHRRARLAPTYNPQDVHTSSSCRVAVSSPTDCIVRDNIASIDPYIRTESTI